MEIHEETWSAKPSSEHPVGGMIIIDMKNRSIRDKKDSRT